MAIEIFIANTDEEIQSCFPTFLALRPHLLEGDFLVRIRRQQEQGYEILALRDDGHIVSVAGYRITENLIWGKFLYLDDLSTLPAATSRGYAGLLLDRLVDHAKSLKCTCLQLDTGYDRHDAHRLYLRKGFKFVCHHLALPLSRCP